MIEKEIVEAHALENALMHNGKAAQGAVLNALFAEGLKKEEIKDALKIVGEVLGEVNAMSEKSMKERYDEIKGKMRKRKTRVGLPDLPDAEKGKVVMRIAPFPSGPLHIGNARQLVLNDEYVKKYDGKMIIVIDDTIGSELKKIEPDAYKLIIESLNWLKVSYDKKIIYKSDRLQIYYDYAKEMIKKGYMYVCDCSQEEVCELRKKGIACGCREMDGGEHLKRWEKMFDAKPGDFTVRLKTSMQHGNPAFRDRVMLKISDREHPRVRKKYRIWPSMDFSWAIDDHLLGITHIIRGVELMIETDVEKFIWDIFKWEHPVVIHTGLFQIKGVKISKSKGAEEVKEGKFIVWNDPRLWSLQSLRDRGFEPEAIRNFILSMGLTKSNSTVAIEVLYALNRKFLEKSPRYFFVENPVKIKINGAPELNEKIPLHPTENLGFRQYQTGQEFYISKRDFDLIDGENYRLMHLFNFKTDNSVMRGKELSFISKEPDKNLKARYMHWVSDNKIDVKVRLASGFVVKGFGERALLKLKEGDVIQFERFGFARLYKLDKKNRVGEFWFAHR